MIEFETSGDLWLALKTRVPPSGCGCVGVGGGSAPAPAGPGEPRTFPAGFPVPSWPAGQRARAGKDALPGAGGVGPRRLAVPRPPGAAHPRRRGRARVGLREASAAGRACSPGTRDARREILWALRPLARALLATTLVPARAAAPASPER